MTSKRISYPEDLRRFLAESYSYLNNMREALARTHEKFPEYKDHLTCERAHSVVTKWRNRNNPDLAPKKISMRKLRWSEMSTLEATAVYRQTKKMYEKRMRWSAIAERLAEKHPGIEIPRPGNLSMAFFCKFPEYRSGKSKQPRKTYIVNDGAPKDIDKIDISLNIIKNGVKILSMPISAEICGRIITQILGE